MRKAAALVLLLALLLTGCADSIQAEKSYSQPHQSRPPIDRDDEELVLSAHDADSIFDAVMALIGIGAERGVIQMFDYEGQPEEDLAGAVLTAANQTPLGAYCVYYIDHSLITTAEGMEVSVSIMYRHTPEEAEGVKECRDGEELTELIYNAMSSRETVVTLLTRSENINETAISSTVEQVYYSNPGDILYIPTCTVTAYPETGAERILEVILTYPYATSTVESRRRSLDSRTRAIVSGLRGKDGRELAQAAAEFIRENVEFDGTVDPSEDLARRYNAMTAYGALVQGRAAGEGCAMAMKVLCDALGLECRVVRGTLNGRGHTWNIVRLDSGEFYHIDPGMYDPEGAVFKNDDQQSYAGYVWDREACPACPGRSLYGPEFDPPAPPETNGEDEPPEVPDGPETPESGQDEPDPGAAPGEAEGTDPLPGEGNPPDGPEAGAPEEPPAEGPEEDDPEEAPPEEPEAGDPDEEPEEGTSEEPKPGEPAENPSGEPEDGGREEDIPPEGPAPDAGTVPGADAGTEDSPDGGEDAAPGSAP